MKRERGHAVVHHLCADVAAHQHEGRTEVERNAETPEPPAAVRDRRDPVVRRHKRERRLDLLAQLRITVKRLARRAIRLGHGEEALRVRPRRPAAVRDIFVVDVAEAAVGEEQSGRSGGAGLRGERVERGLHPRRGTIGARGRVVIRDVLRDRVARWRGVQRRDEKQSDGKGEERFHSMGKGFAALVLFPNNYGADMSDSFVMSSFSNCAPSALMPIHASPSNTATAGIAAMPRKAGLPPKNLCASKSDGTKTIAAGMSATPSTKRLPASVTRRCPIITNPRGSSLL